MGMQWHGKEFLEKLRQENRRRMEAACIHLTNKIRENLSTGQSYTRYVGQTVSYKGHDPSAPGDPPHLITGELRSSIAYEIDKDGEIGRVGSALEKAKDLELGTSQMSARPYLRATLNQEKAEIGRILGAK